MPVFFGAGKIQARTDGSRSLTCPAIADMNARLPFRFLRFEWTWVFLASSVILYFFPPSNYPFYPECVFHAWTGLDCPGCGSLRAAHDLLHGNLIGAFYLNAAFVLFLPIAGMQSLRPWMSRKLQIALLDVRKQFWWAGLAAVILYSISRNIPSFSWRGL